MKVGVHVSLWTPEWDDPFIEYIKKAAQIGFDVVELPLMDLGKINTGQIKTVVQDNGLEVCCGTGLGPHNDISSPDKKIRQKGSDHLSECLEIAKEVGSASLGGVIHSAWGKHETVTEDDRNLSAEILRQIAEKAKGYGMRMALECINRYESSFLNTAEQGLHMLKLIEMPNVGLHLDTYHMNIEEKSIAAGLESAGSSLYHLHLSENDRGFPGNGSINWKDVFSAAEHIGYKGYFVIESYITPGTGSGNDVCIWRNIEKDAENSLKKSLEFIRTNE